MAVPGWPDQDRSDDALERILADVDHADELWPSRTGAMTTLTRRERECLTACAAGLEYTEAALILGIGLESFKTHMRKARRAMRAKNTVQAVAEALRQGQIS